MAQSKSSIPSLMYAALGQYQAGALGEARALVEQVLHLDSLRADALHLLGLISCAQGDTNRGIQLPPGYLMYGAAFTGAWPDSRQSLGAPRGASTPSTLP